MLTAPFRLKCAVSGIVAGVVAAHPPAPGTPPGHAGLGTVGTVIVNVPLAAVLPVRPLIVTCSPVAKGWGVAVVIWRTGVSGSAGGAGGGIRTFAAPVIVRSGSSKIGPP